jgi:hypothetical protein
MKLYNSLATDINLGHFHNSDRFSGVLHRTNVAGAHHQADELEIFSILCALCQRNYIQRKYKPLLKLKAEPPTFSVSRHGRPQGGKGALATLWKIRKK